ncbi:hypothetical protein F5J12DRAFT_118834 [Pisolithus orientalis]|uniref:uncharacterized protein n=1 Tax=Pisolithus orientalis TaxID=936130 RepID=UPI0022242EEC|nr:uncharacterized protein F5J12DRAFT_118834 [Pisolithus orientalis]KAI5983562.1 hypothetical protein F5J12DRAFT_118834 [Pisolithus orientalis]
MSAVQITAHWTPEALVVHNAYRHVGHPDNPSFVGSEPLETLADRIRRSAGLSGRNKTCIASSTSPLGIQNMG